MMSGEPHTFLRSAVLQPPLEFGHRMQNLHLLRSLCEQTVAHAPLDLILLPEIFDGHPDPTDGDDMEKFLSNIAKACDSHIIGGGAPVADPLSGKSHNRAVICHRNGDIIGRYDKRVLFSSEQDARMPGAAEGIVELDGFRVGILICADLWDPALSRAMSGRVDVLAVGVKSSVPTEGHIKYARQLWHSMSLIRAMENGFALLVADWPEARHDFGRGEQGVRTRETHYTSGASTIVDPSHRPDLERIQKTIVPGRTGVLRADIRLEALDTFRDYRRRVGLLPPAPD